MGLLSRRSSLPQIILVAFMAYILGVMTPQMGKQTAQFIHSRYLTESHGTAGWVTRGLEETNEEPKSIEELEAEIKELTKERDELEEEESEEKEEEEGGFDLTSVSSGFLQKISI